MKNTNVLYQFQNCRVLRNHNLVKEDFWVRNGKIVNPEPIFFEEKIPADVQVDCRGAIISPGFIDLQINGGFGVDFSHNVNDTTSIIKGLDLVAKGLLSHGVTSFCPTIVTSSPEVYRKVIPVIKKRAGSKQGAGVLGLHLEGPFINRDKKGAHQLELLRELDEGFKTLMETYGSLDNVSIVTLAPELDKSNEVIPKLRDQNIVVSVGHSMANLSIGEKAVRNGATFVTHLFNAMLPFHHRDPGLLGLLTSDQIPEQPIYFGIIADEIHTHPAAVRLAQRTQPAGLVLVTDAISALGLNEGRHNIGQLEIEVRNNRALIAGTETLCGSISNMNECVKNLYHVTKCSNVYALEAATLHPAKTLGIEGVKGSLVFNADADFLMLDDDLNVCSTWIAGECVWINDKHTERHIVMALKN